MNTVQYIILNKDIKMSTGKAAAQAAHASVEGLRLQAEAKLGPWSNPWDLSIVNRWYRGGHYAKVVLETYDPWTAKEYLRARGFETAIIIDEGRTEVDALTPTALGSGVVDKDQPHVRESFVEFKLYRDDPEPLAEKHVINALAAGAFGNWRTVKAKVKARRKETDPVLRFRDHPFL